MPRYRHSCGRRFKVSYYYDSGAALNITKIPVTGLTGDPANYTDALRLYGPGPIQAQLVYRGPVDCTSYEGYVKAFYVYFTDPYRTQGAGFIGGATVTINPGQCAAAGVYLMIDPSIPLDSANGRTILATSNSPPSSVFKKLQLFLTLLNQAPSHDISSNLSMEVLKRRNGIKHEVISVDGRTILVVTTQFNRPEPTVRTFSKKLQPFIVWVRGNTISYWYYVFGSKVEIE